MCPPPVATMSNNHLQLSYSTIDNILTNLLPAGLQDFFQVANVSNGTMMANKLMECFPYGIVYCTGFKSGLFGSAPHMLQLATHELMLYHHLLTDAFSYLHLLCQNNAHFFSVFLFVYAVQVLNALFYANFRKLH